MIRPSISKERSILRKYDILVESECYKKKDLLHFHDYVQIWYVFSGTICHSVSGKSYLQLPGSCVVVLPFTEHAINTLDSDDTPVAISLSFTDNFLTDRGDSFFSYFRESAHFGGCSIPEFSLLENERKEKTDKLMRKMLAEFAHDKNTDFDELFRLLHQFLNVLCQETADSIPSTHTLNRTKGILRAIRYMADNLGRRILRDELCSIAAMSRTDFSKTFKEMTGATTKQLLLSLRLRRAEYLLQFTDKSLNEVAEEVGLYDKSRLTHLFCEHFGMSPVQFRHTTRPHALESDKAVRRRMVFYPKYLMGENSADTLQ